jgi:hypothetical protein
MMRTAIVGSTHGSLKAWVGFLEYLKSNNITQLTSTKYALARYLGADRAIKEVNAELRE